MLQVGERPGGGHSFIAPAQWRVQALLRVTANTPLWRTTKLPAASGLEPSVGIRRVRPGVEYDGTTWAPGASLTSVSTGLSSRSLSGSAGEHRVFRRFQHPIKNKTVLHCIFSLLSKVKTSSAVCEGCLVLWIYIWYSEYILWSIHYWYRY